MRIAVAFDCLFPWTKGGGERLYRTFAEEWVACGHEVTYLTRRQWDGEAPELPGIRVVAVSEDRELHDADGVRRTGPALRFGRGLYRHLRQHHGDYDTVLVSATPATNVLAARAALIGSGVPLAVDWLEVWRRGQWLEYCGPVLGRVANRLQRLAIRLSPMATCHSGLTARRLRERRVPAEPVLSPGLIDELPAARPALSANEPPRIVFIGRHIPDKHVDVLPAAVAHARLRLPELTATIFGEGPSRDLVRAEVERLGLGGVVRLPGFVGQGELDTALRSASCLVNPSTREGYGLVVVESCAAATPVVLVAGEDNAAVELVENGVNGRVSPSLDPAALGTTIVEVITAGTPLRHTTHQWFLEASRTRTARAAARHIAEHLATLTPATTRHLKPASP